MATNSQTAVRPASSAGGSNISSDIPPFDDAQHSGGFNNGEEAEGPYDVNGVRAAEAAGGAPSVITGQSEGFRRSTLGTVLHLKTYVLQKGFACISPA